MGKGRQPRKPKDPTPDTGEEREPERQTEPKGDLMPPSRRPPTTVAAETPQPPREPIRLQPRPAPAGRAPALAQLLDTIRAVAGAMLDLADAAADALTKRLAGRP